MATAQHMYAIKSFVLHLIVFAWSFYGVSIFIMTLMLKSAIFIINSPVYYQTDRALTLNMLAGIFFYFLRAFVSNNSMVENHLPLCLLNIP